MVADELSTVVSFPKAETKLIAFNTTDLSVIGQVNGTNAHSTLGIQLASVQPKEQLTYADGINLHASQVYYDVSMKSGAMGIGRLLVMHRPDNNSTLLSNDFSAIQVNDSNSFDLSNQQLVVRAHNHAQVQRVCPINNFLIDNSCRACNEASVGSLNKTLFSWRAQQDTCVACGHQMGNGTVAQFLCRAKGEMPPAVQVKNATNHTIRVNET